MIICLTEEDVDKLTAATTIDNFKETELRSDHSPPSPLKAKKTVIIKCLDRNITTPAKEELKQDIQKRNTWYKMEEVISSEICLIYSKRGLRTSKWQPQK